MRILVIEDEHRIAQSIKKGLEQEHYAVDVAYDGLDGYDLATTEEYDLILLDLMLPSKDGLSICRDLRGQKINIPILMLTARGQTDDKITGLDAGADDYLTKPFSFDELLARIRALCRRPAPALSTVLAVGDLTLDTTNYLVTRRGVNIKLSGKEYSLLEFFMRHPHQILRKERIIGHVWDYDSDILPNTVEVYIKNLRHKIDTPFPHQKPLFTTIRGFGYRLG
ncbi:MAG: response regulator transcription factor [Microgenomates group bacterium]